MSEEHLEKISYDFAAWLVLRQLVNPSRATLKCWLEVNLKNYSFAPRALIATDFDSVWVRWSKYIVVNHY